MRTIKYKILIAGLVLIGSVAAAYAQMPTGPYGVKFHTSFPFTVAGHMMPAGDYAVRHMGGMRDPRFSLMLENRDDGERVMLNTVAGASKSRFLTRTGVVFDVIDGQYFLTEIRSAGSEAGNRIPLSSVQRRMMAMARPVRTIVVSTDTGF